MKIPSYQDLIIDNIQDGLRASEDAWPLNYSDVQAIFGDNRTYETPIRALCVAMHLNLMDDGAEPIIIADLCQDCPGFAYDFLCLQQQFHPDRAPDPHFRRTDGFYCTCFFHVHGKDEPCLTQPHDDQSCTDCQGYLKFP